MHIGVCGAGVAGPTLAFWLSRFGHKVTLIEQASAPRSGGYMIDFWGVGYDVAERMGLRDAVHAAGYALQEVRYVDRRGHIVGRIGVEVMRRELGDRFTSLPRGALATTLYGALPADVGTLFGASVAAIEARDTGVSVRLTNGVVRDFDLLVGADGLRSAVRRLALGPHGMFERPLGYHVAAFEASGYRPRDELAYVSYGDPGRQISRFSERGGRTMFLLVYASERAPADGPSDLPTRKAVLRAVFDGAGWEWPAIRSVLDSCDELYFDQVSQIVMPAWSKGRIVLVGDAASAVSLVAGEGAGIGMAAAYVLAGEIRAHPSDPAVALAAYEGRMRPFIERKQAAARSFAASFTPRTAFGVWLRNTATFAMAIPGLPGLLLGPQLRDDLALPDYNEPETLPTRLERSSRS